ncbi:MAG: isochorismatase family cysteine hydrolase [Chloroflexota bacterium]
MGKAAVLVIDMVRDFTDLEIGKVANKPAAEMVPRLNAFVQSAREIGAQIIWVVDRHRAGKPDWELDHVRGHCMDDTEGIEIDHGLEQRPEDYQIYKRRFSAFMGTDLDMILRDNHIDTIVLTGTKTNVCIRATAQDGFAYNYHVIVPLECVATDKQHLHDANLEDIGKYMGRVVSAEEALGLIQEKIAVR